MNSTTFKPSRHTPAPPLAAPVRVRHSAPPPATPHVTADRIRQRAFEIFQSRRGGPGDPLTDWLQAERELSREASAGGHVESRGEILMHDDE